MTRDEESEKIRALLREAHSDDELSCPPFRRLMNDARARNMEPHRRVRTLVVAALAVSASVAAVVFFRGERPAPVGRPVALAAAAHGPLDFLLQLPGSAPLDPLASLRPPLFSGSDSNEWR